jgi:hypothetical protein
MKLGHAICGLLLMALLISCKSQPISAEQGILDSELSKAYAAYEETMTLKRSRLQFSDGEEVDHCAAYLNAFNDKTIVETTSNQIVKSEYLVCDALNLLSRSTGVTSANIDRNQIGEYLLNKLDTRTFQSSFSRLAEDNKNTLSQLFSDQASSEGASASYETEDWYFNIRAVAVADINKNAEPDWILQLTDESKTGSYRGYATLVIYDFSSSNKLKAVPYP